MWFCERVGLDVLLLLCSALDLGEGPFFSGFWYRHTWHGVRSPPLGGQIDIMGRRKTGAVFKGVIVLYWVVGIAI